jgi:hypothetical protein
MFARKVIAAPVTTTPPLGEGWCLELLLLGNSAAAVRMLARLLLL